MDKLNLNNLPDDLGNNYLILISNKNIDINSLDEELNSSGVVTGLVDEYVYLSNSDDFVSLLIKMDEDSRIDESKLNSKINDSMYICDPKNYMQMSSLYSFQKINSELDDKEFDTSDRSYGYNDIKVMMKILNKSEIKVVMIVPFVSSDVVLSQISSTFSKMFHLLYGSDIVEDSVPDQISSIALRFILPFDKIASKGRRSFDMIINQLLSIINMDRYSSLEYLSLNDKVRSLLN